MAPGFDQLAAEHDAVVLAMGARRARDLAVPGRELPGVVWAMDYLEAQNRHVGGAPLPLDLSAAGKRVVILGGGDTGSDCLGTAHRQGAAHVEQIELLPAPPQSRARRELVAALAAGLPDLLEPGGGREAGVRALHHAAHRPERVARGDGARPGADWSRTRRAEGASSRSPAPRRRARWTCSSWRWGSSAPRRAPWSPSSGSRLDARGNVRVDGRFRTSRPGIWAVGDTRRGASLIVWAISDGREAARDIDSVLTGGPSRLPTRGADAPFIVPA